MVSIATVYGGERMPVHLYLPKNVKPPYEAVLFFPGALAIGADNSANLQLNTFGIDFIVLSGRALVYPVYKYTYGRVTRIVVMAPIDARLHHLGAAARWRCQTVARLSGARAGHRRRGWPTMVCRGAGSSGQSSWRSTRASRRVLLLMGGLKSGQSAPEVDSFNFAPRVRIPILMLNGDQDYIFPLQTSQRPLFEDCAHRTRTRSTCYIPAGTRSL